MSEDKDAEIARLESEVALHRQRYGEEILACIALAPVSDKTWMNCSPSAIVGEWKSRAERAESRLSALAAAAREYREAERSRWSALFALEGRQVAEGADHRPEVWPEMRAYDESEGVLGERRRALDALLSGEEGR